LPELIKQATFNSLKLALEEDLDDSKRQMICLGKIFTMLNKSADTESCLAMNSIIGEAHKKIAFAADNKYESDMTIIFYMNIIENLQLGASRILNLIATKPEFESYAQQIKESFDISRDNARLFHVIAREYLGEI
jgi:ferritin-like metal-binding protein YciE